MRICLAALFLIGCGKAPAQVTGTVAGAALHAKDAVALTETSQARITIAVFDRDRVCDELKMAQTFPSATVFQLGVQVPAGQQVAAGTFAIGDVAVAPLAAGVAFAAFAHNDAQCKASAVSATSGAVSITHITWNGLNATASGHFDVSFDSGDRLTGTFDAPSCTVGTDSSLPQKSGLVCSDL